MNDAKHIGLDVHHATISATVLDSTGKLAMESVLETKPGTLLQFIHGLRGSLHVTFEEGTCAAWLHDLLKPHVTQVLVCDPRKNALLKVGNKSDRIEFAPDLPNVTFSPHLLCNSPRLNDLATRSNEYLTSKRFFLTTVKFRATIPYEVGAPASFHPPGHSLSSRKQSTPFFSSNPNLPAVAGLLFTPLAQLAQSLEASAVREGLQKHQNSDINYL